jgi:error-prone DNA polymerase
MRLGLRYVKGLNEVSGSAIELERKRKPFESIDDLHQRVPEVRKDELRKLAAVGALNFIQTNVQQTSACRPGETNKPQAHFRSETRDLKIGTHRRDALWQVERVARAAGPLFEALHERDANSPLAQMTVAERMSADFRGTGLTIGKHPVGTYRAELHKLGATRAVDIYEQKNGLAIRVAGWVIVRQRPGTAKGFMFLTLEDETGVANIIVTPQLFEKNRRALVDYPFLMIEGTLQNQDNVVSVKAKRIRPLSFKIAAAPSHDFH